MKTLKIISAYMAGSLLFGVYTGNSVADTSGTTDDIKVDANAVLRQAAKAKIPFIQNQGQVNKDVIFYTRLFSGTLFVTNDNALVYSVMGKAQQDINKRTANLRWSFRESFINQKPSQPRGIAPSAIQVSQFKGNQPESWRQQLPVFNRVDLGEVYAGIRVALQATGNNVEKLFYVAPGAKVSDIKVAVEGVQDAAINSDGQLILKTGLGDVAFTAPVAYQEINGMRHTVAVNYALANNTSGLNNTYGFRLGDYNPAYEIVIDPLLASTYLGGVNANPAQYSNYDQDIAYSVIAVGDSVYVGGVTQSTDFPVVLGYDDTPNDSGRPDGFIARFSNDLSTLYSSTYFGTENFDRVSAIAMDTDGTVVAVGQAGYGFPVTAGAYNYQGSEPVGGGFVAKFSADLSSLIASAVVTPSDYPTQLTIGNGSIYFGGRTNVPSFPITEGAYLSTCCRIISSYGQRDFDGFAGKISTDLSTLEAMTYLGGDGVTSIAVAPDSSLYITDGFGSAITGYLAHMDADLTSQFARVTLYPGGTNSGSSRHYFYDVVVGDGYVVTVGQTYLNDLPVTPGAFDTTCGSDGDCDNSSDTLYIPKPDGFITKYSLDLQTVLARTFFGGNNADSLGHVSLDSNGNIIVAGSTLSPDMPTSSNAHDSICGTGGNCGDVFVARLNNDLSQLLYGSYLGGSEGESAYDLAVAADDTVYISGATDSADFPTTSGAFDRTYAGGAGGPDAPYDTDAFISQFDMTSDGSGGGGGGGSTNTDPIADAGSDQTVGPQQTVYLDGRNSSDSDGSIVQYEWTQVSGRKVTLTNANYPIASFESPRVRRNKSKTLVFELTVIDDQGAMATDQITVLVTR